MCPWLGTLLCYIYVTICGTLYGHPTTIPPPIRFVLETGTEMRSGSCLGITSRVQQISNSCVFLKHRHLPCQAGMICHEKCWFLWILDGISDDLMIYRVGISNLGWHLMKTWLVNDEIHQPDICNLVLGWSLHGTLPHVATFPASSTEWIRETHCFSPIIPLCWTARAANWWWPIYLCMYVCMYLFMMTYLSIILTISRNTHLTYLSAINPWVVIATGFRVDQVDQVELWVRTVRRMRSDCRANWSK